MGVFLQQEPVSEALNKALPALLPLGLVGAFSQSTPFMCYEHLCLCTYAYFGALGVFRHPGLTGLLVVACLVSAGAMKIKCVS
jgi:hypothetical protein